MTRLALHNLACLAQAAQPNPVQLDPDMWMIVWMFVGLLFVIGVIRSCNRRPWVFLCGIALLFAMVPLFRYLSVRQPAAPVAQAEEIDAETDVDTAAIKARIKSLEEGERPLIPLDGTETEDDPESVDSLADPQSANEPRPDWLDRPAKRVGNVERRVIAIGPWATVEDCYHYLGEVAVQQTREFIQQEFATEELSDLDLAIMGITTNYVTREICTDEYIETREHDFGDAGDVEMKTLHVLMKFDPGVRDDLRRKVDHLSRRGNLIGVSLASLGVFSILGLAYGLLKVDRWTDGRYSKRLFIGVPLVIIFLLGALFGTIP